MPLVLAARERLVRRHGRPVLQEQDAAVGGLFGVAIEADAVRLNGLARLETRLHRSPNLGGDISNHFLFVGVMAIPCTHGPLGDGWSWSLGFTCPCMFM